MPRLSKLIVSLRGELPVTPRHEAWLDATPNLTYTQKAKQWLASEIGKPGRIRSGSFSASSALMCPRKRMFSYLGLSESRRLEGRTTSIFHNGTWTHLRWQAAGMSAGWLAEPEVPSAYPDLLLKGTLDGVLDTGEGLELKSINSHGYRYLTTANAPKRAHLAQVGAYFLATGLDTFSVVYENKDTQDYHEFVVHQTPDLVDHARADLEPLVTAVETRTLPEVKDLCWAKQGAEYLQCPYKTICPTVQSWTHAEEIVAAQAQDQTPPVTAGSPTRTESKLSGLRLRRMFSSPNG